MKGLAREDVIDHVPIDGKTLRGSRSAGYEAVHLLSAYCGNLQGVLAQVEAPPGENEIAAAMRMLKGVPLEGTVVTGDAIFCRKRICGEVLEPPGPVINPMPMVTRHRRTCVVSTASRLSARPGDARSAQRSTGACGLSE